MRALIWIGISWIICSQALWAATAAPPAPTTCVDLTGSYVLPLGKHDRTDDPPLLMIRQDHCRLISVVVGYGGFVPIGENSSLDGTEGFFIAGNTIVEKGSLSIPTATHGQCSAQSIAMSLDSDKNMVFTSPMVSGCEDKYKGALHDTFPRVGWVKPTSLAASNVITCTDAKGRSVAVGDSSYTFQNLDAAGFPSGKAYTIVGSHYVEVPGGPEYSEYTGDLDGVKALVRMNQTKGGTVAEVWSGPTAKGTATFTGACSGTQN